MPPHVLPTTILSRIPRVADVFLSVILQKGIQVTLDKRTLQSIENGKEVNNQLLTDLSQLLDCVKTQNETFSKIAELIKIKDNQIKF